MLSVQVDSNRISFGKEFSVSFQRTLRIPDDGKIYPLPPGLGNFPIKKVDDYRKSVPPSWLEHVGVFIPMYQREALWILFHDPYEMPHAVKIGVGKINAISGKEWSDQLGKDGQDYLVAPAQPWLDGIKSGEGYIRQFVAMPLGMGYTVEGQITGKEEFGGIQILVVPPEKAKWFPRKRERIRFAQPMEGNSLFCESMNMLQTLVCNDSGEMGLGAGGRMEQQVYVDEYGLDMWDKQNSGRVFVHIVNSMMYRQITGEEAPPTPITAHTYAENGLPWFLLYNETKQDLPAGDPLKVVKSIKEMDAGKGFKPQQDDSPIDLKENSIVTLHSKDDVRDGNW